MAELLLIVAVLVPIVGLMLGWGLQRKRSDVRVHECHRCQTEVRSRWEIKRCPVCMKPYAG